MSRRFEKYKLFVESLEKTLSNLIIQYRVFINNTNTNYLYQEFEKENSKVKVYLAPEDFVFKNGHALVYNYLEKNISSDYIVKLFDSDEISISDYDLFIKELDEDFDIGGMSTYMERGNSQEIKYQMYRPNILKWVGHLHENQEIKIQNPKVKNLKYLSVYHHNALDTDSRILEKTEDGFIILTKNEDETSDSFQRNMLYEALTYRIIHENLYHPHIGWYKRHYEINKDVITFYYKKAKEKYKLL